MIGETASKLQGLIAQKTLQAQEEVANKSKELKPMAIKNNKKREAQRKKATDTSEANELELQKETSQLIIQMKATAETDGVSQFGRAVLDVLNNYQAGINTIRSMAKNMYDGLFFLTNDVRGVEQTQSIIINRLDRLDSKVINRLPSF